MELRKYLLDLSGLPVEAKVQILRKMEKLSWTGEAKTKNSDITEWAIDDRHLSAILQFVPDGSLRPAP